MTLRGCRFATIRYFVGMYKKGNVRMTYLDLKRAGFSIRSFSIALLIEGITSFSISSIRSVERSLMGSFESSKVVNTGEGLFIPIVKFLNCFFTGKRFTSLCNNFFPRHLIDSFLISGRIFLYNIVLGFLLHLLELPCEIRTSPLLGYSSKLLKESEIYA
jgi:hypothetical protein